MALLENVRYTLEGQKLVLEIDLSGDLGTSSTGKSKLVARSRGCTVKGGYKFNLVVYHPGLVSDLPSLVSSPVLAQEQD